MKSSTPSTYTVSERQGNFELLRIVAAFMVLIVHANFGTIGEVQSYEFTDNPLSAYTRTIIQVISSVSVNIFILISGWFGIRPTKKGACNFIFQWWFYLIGLGIFGAVLSYSHSLSAFKEFMIEIIYTHNTYGWFCVAYITLYIMSPILNTWIKHTSKREFTLVLVGIFTLSFASYVGFCGTFNGGYSAIGLITVYLLGRYISVYQKHWSKYGFCIWLISVSLSTAHYIHPIEIPYMALFLGSYNNPLVISGAVGLILWFSTISIKMNRIISMMSSSAFSIYIIHTHPAILEKYFQPLVLHTYHLSEGLSRGFYFGITLAAIYLLCTCIDRFRTILWSYFVSRVFSQREQQKLQIASN